MVEMISEFSQLDSILGVTWIDMAGDAPRMLECILSLLSMNKLDISSLFGIPDIECTICKYCIRMKNQLIYNVETDHLQSSLLFFDLKMLLRVLIDRNSQMNECCIRSSKFKDIHEKILVLVLSQPIDMDIIVNQTINSAHFTFLAALCKERSNVDSAFITHFNLENQIVSQIDKRIVRSKNQFEHVKALCFFCGQNQITIHRTKSDEFIYDQKIQKQMCRKYDKTMNTIRYKEKERLVREYEKKRGKDQTRRQYKKIIDQNRDVTVERKEAHKKNGIKALRENQETKQKKGRRLTKLLIANEIKASRENYEIKQKKGVKCIRKWTKSVMKLNRGKRCIG